MPNRKSKNGEQPSIVFSRSPNFRHCNQTEPEDLKTPSPEHGSTRESFLEPPPFISTQKVPLKTAQNHSSEVQNVLNESDIGSEGSAEPYTTGSRRSKILNSGVEGFNCLRRSLWFCNKENVKLGVKRVNFNELKTEGNNLHNQFLGDVVKRVTRSSSQRFSNVKADEGTCTGYIEFDSANFSDKVDFSDEQTAEADVNLSKQSAGKIEKKKTGSSNWQNAYKPAKKSGGHKSDRSVECSKYECEEKGAFFGVDKKAELGFDPFVQATMGAHSSRASLEIGGERKGAGVEKEQKCVEVKRKRIQVEEDHGNHGIVQGWTKDQELALQKAYFAAKPTPRFWKKVSGMVPGKSAQDCFNKIHAGHLTPPQRQTRSRAKVTNSSSLSLSATKLLDSAGPNSKKPRYSTRKSDLAQKIARQLLQKQHQADQDQNADLFSVLEPTPSPSAKAFRQVVKYSSPDHNQEKPKLLKGYQERSSSAHRKQFSRFRGSTGATLASPLVLKQVKNRALHEKYIDQLHKREAKRNAASAKAAKSSYKKVDGKKSHVQNINAIEAAKIALVRDARDAIIQFQHVQVNAMNSFSDADVYCSVEDEGDDRP